jgi:hypothetical protein
MTSSCDEFSLSTIFSIPTNLKYFPADPLVFFLIGATKKYYLAQPTGN